MFVRAKYSCCSFRDVMTSTLASIRRLKTVELFGSVFLKLVEAKSNNYRFHIATRFKS